MGFIERGAWGHEKRTQQRSSQSKRRVMNPDPSREKAATRTKNADPQFKVSCRLWSKATKELVTEIEQSSSSLTLKRLYSADKSPSSCHHQVGDQAPTGTYITYTCARLLLGPRPRSQGRRTEVLRVHPSAARTLIMQQARDGITQMELQRREAASVSWMTRCRSDATFGFLLGSAPHPVPPCAASRSRQRVYL